MKNRTCYAYLLRSRFFYVGCRTFALGNQNKTERQWCRKQKYLRIRQKKDAEEADFQRQVLCRHGQDGPTTVGADQPVQDAQNGRQRSSEPTLLCTVS